LLHSLDRLALRIACCLILHNMLVRDGVMGDVGDEYKPDEDFRRVNVFVLGRSGKAKKIQVTIS
jgi:hypothetical protein